MSNNNTQQNANELHFESGYIHCTESEKHTIYNLLAGIVASARADKNPQGFAVSQSIILIDQQSWFDINQTILKLLTPKK